MCVSASETSRPRLYNWVSVVLISSWVLIVSAIAHSVPTNESEKGQQFATFEATMVGLVDTAVAVFSAPN